MRIISRIRRHTSLLALLCVLCALAAAPYLVPANPDSAAFRSGTWGTLLALACLYPLHQAFSRANLHTLVCGAGFGLLFSLALSLGSELLIYGGLLPGMGSMLRRIAVPLLSTPLLGGLAARCMLPPQNAQRRSLRLPYWGYMAILLLCWLPLLAAYFPGMLNYDFHTEYQQWLQGQWDARHPLLYIVLCYAILDVGRMLHQPELAIVALTLLRMLALAAALAYACVFLQRRRAPAWVCVLMIAAYGLIPIFPVMAVSSAKDTPFAAALLVLSLLSWEAIEDPNAFLGSRRRCAAFLLALFFTWHMRKNGIAAMLLLPLLVLAARGRRKAMAALCATGALICVLLGAGMNAVLQPAKQPSFQTYSLPAQQLARAYNLGEMTEEERSELRSWYVDSDWGLQLLPHLADAAKGSLDPQRLEQEGDAFMDLWTRVGRKNLRVYAEAFLLLNIGSWYPDDQSHATIYQPYGLDKGYLQTDEYDLSEYGIGKHNPLPRLRSLFERICRRNVYLEYPLISTLLCTATPLWVILFACTLLIARRQTRFLPAASGVLAIHLSYLLGPCTLARYMLPLFCLAPVLLAAAWQLPPQFHQRKETPSCLPL